MDANRNLEPYLVELDNLGESNSSPSEYTLLWWLKQILDATGSAISRVPVDVRSGDWKTIDDSIFVVLCEYKPSVSTSFKLAQMDISLRGFSAEFILEYSFDGTILETIRSFILSTQQSSFSLNFGQPITLSLDGVNGYARIKCRMLYQNQTGIASASLNGFV